MKKWVVLLLALALCVVPAAALDGEAVPGWDGLWDQAEDYGVSQDTGLEGGLSQLVVQGLEQLKALAGRSIATGVKLLAVVLVCGLAQSAALPGQQEGVQAAELAGALAITALTMTDVAAMIGLGRETLRRMDDFAQALLPVMAALTAATGRVSGAAVGQGVTVLFSQLLLDAMDGLLIPLIDGYVAVSCAWAAVDSPGLKKLGELMKGAAALILTGLLLAFVGIAAGVALGYTGSANWVIQFLPCVWAVLTCRDTGMGKPLLLFTLGLAVLDAIIKQTAFLESFSLSNFLWNLASGCILYAVLGGIGWLIGWLLHYAKETTHENKE